MTSCESFVVTAVCFRGQATAGAVGDREEIRISFAMAKAGSEVDVQPAGETTSPAPAIQSDGSQTSDEEMVPEQPKSLSKKSAKGKAPKGTPGTGILPVEPELTHTLYKKVFFRAFLLR